MEGQNLPVYNGELERRKKNKRSGPYILEKSVYLATCVCTVCGKQVLQQHWWC